MGWSFESFREGKMAGFLGLMRGIRGWDRVEEEEEGREGEVRHNESDMINGCGEIN